MQKFATTVTDQSSGAVKPITNALVYLYQSGTNREAVLYEDNEYTRKANPLSTDANGFVDCKLTNGTYDIWIYAGTVVKKIVGFCAFDGNQSAVSITMPAQFTVTGGLNATWNKQAKNTFLAGPSNAADAVPDFRAIGMADLPFTGTADTSRFLRGDLSWAPVPGVFSASFESAEQAITTAGPLTIAHGLGVVPKLIYGVLVCKTAEAGYAVGDVLSVPLGYLGGPAASSAGIVADSSSIKVRYGSAGSVFYAIHFTSGNGVGLTNANWRLILRAFA